VVKSIRQKDPSRPHMDGSVVFRQVAPMCSPSNTWLSLIHPSPYFKRHPDRFSRFLHSSRQSPYLQRAATPQKKIATSHGGFEPHLIHGSSSPPRVHNANGKSIRSAVFCRAHDRDRPTDRQTDHATPSVTIGRIYVRSTAMRPNLLVGSMYTS